MGKVIEKVVAEQLFQFCEKFSKLYPDCKRVPRGKSADYQSPLSQAQRDAQREWTKLRFGHVQSHMQVESCD